MLANIIIIAILVSLVTLAIRKIVRDKKTGAGSCGCGCSSCPSHSCCHPSEIPERFKLKK
ncbi:MAG: FeoB-associated Cys-rich membrane protein [Lachnospiraceae bacterium]|jgi:hypothetical protein|nr:FeoB-associated Cys-rich membrane protein [Lachnospiraceae bacterium]